MSIWEFNSIKFPLSENWESSWAFFLFSYAPHFFNPTPTTLKIDEWNFSSSNSSLRALLFLRRGCVQSISLFFLNITSVEREIHKKFLHITSLCVTTGLLLFCLAHYDDDYHCCKQIFFVFRGEIKRESRCGCLKIDIHVKIKVQNDFI